MPAEMGIELEMEKETELNTANHASVNLGFRGDAEDEKELNGSIEIDCNDENWMGGKVSKVKLEWKNLTVDAVLPPPSLFDKMKSCCKKEKRQLLGEKTKPIIKGVDGVVEPGTLLAIMGASGAGKTTLLNVLSRQERSRLKIKGAILVNDTNIKGKIKSISAYVRQDTLFIGSLTVKEHLMFQALLRMGHHHSKEEKKQRVMDVMNMLSLTKCQNTMIGITGRLRGISGGELKRLSFASELILNPSLLFVDEPTSGLDSFMAESSIVALQELAKQGKTIITTIHQPSSEVFYLFDRLLLMSEGRNAFLGTKDEAVEFFQSIGYPCPMNYNPADHYIRQLAISPEKVEESKEKCNFICDKFAETLSIGEKDVSEENGYDVEEIAVAKYKENFFVQTNAVFMRATRSFYREPFYTKVKIFQNIFVGIIAGLIYLQQGDGQAAVRNINGAIFFLIINLTFNYVIAASTVFSTEVPIFLKENTQRMYRIDAYFIGRTLSEFPFVTFTSTLTIVILYWMTGLYSGAKQFFMFYGVMQLVIQTAISYGYLISALSPTPMVATALAAPMILPFLLFGGFFIQDKSIPVYFVWLKIFSWFKYGNEAAQIIQWADFGPLSCKNGTEACIPNGVAVLHLNGYDPANLHEDIGWLIGLLFLFRVVAFLVILLKTYRNK